MYSFYGGKQGAPFVIVKSFPSVSTMIEAFQQGYSYTEVGFDEYVLINTEDKNSPDNGALYRRGYNFSEEIKETDEQGNEISKPTGGAIYIGTIVGPEGSPTLLELAPYDDVIEKNNNQLNEGDVKVFAQGSFNLTNRDLVAGNTTDEILWASYCIRNNEDDDVNTILGFKVPYTVFDFNIEIEEDSTKAATAEKEEEIDEITNEVKIHPFYEQWKLTLPRGFRGSSIDNLRVIEANSEDVIYEDESKKENDDRKIWVYDVTTQKVEKDGDVKNFPIETKTYYAGPCREIEDIQLLDNGTIQIENAYKEEKIINKNNPIKFIKDISIDANSKLLTVEYNTKTNNKNDSVTFDTPLNSIEKMVINPEDYHLLVYYSSKVVRNNEDLKKSGYDNGEWVDLGSVKSDSGILIGLDLDGEYTIQEAIDELNQLYPLGLGGLKDGYSLHGRIVTATDSDNGNKNFFAYDYNKEKNGWYFLGNLDSDASSGANPVVIGKSTDSTIGNSLPEGGIWLVTTEI